MKNALTYAVVAAALVLFNLVLSKDGVVWSTVAFFTFILFKEVTDADK